MKLKTNIRFEEAYLPKRCRKLRYNERAEAVVNTIKEVSKDDVLLAFNDISYNGRGSIYLYNGKLYAKCKGRDFIYNYEGSALDALTEVHAMYSTYFSTRVNDRDENRAEVINRLRNDLRKYLIIGGELFSMIGCPIYRIMTFGLGNGHGSTGLFVDYINGKYNYRKALKTVCYFSANNGEEAIAEAQRVAHRRMDDDIFEPLLEVYLPEIVPNYKRNN